MWTVLLLLLITPFPSRRYDFASSTSNLLFSPFPFHFDNVLMLSFADAFLFNVYNSISSSWRRSFSGHAENENADEVSS